MATTTSNGDDAKKKSLHASERDRPDVVALRERFCRRLMDWPLNRLVFVDESGINLAMTRATAWAPRGERIADPVPCRRWQTYSVIAALRTTGIVAPMVLPGAMNTESMRAWVKTELVPKLRRGDIVVWDNLGIHGDQELHTMISRRGARLEFLPPYSPELNPIEEAWSKMKTILRTAKARAFDALVNALGDALGLISSQDCLGWFAHAGYAAT